VSLSKIAGRLAASASASRQNTRPSARIATTSVPRRRPATVSAMERLEVPFSASERFIVKHTTERVYRSRWALWISSSKRSRNRASSTIRPPPIESGSKSGDSVIVRADRSCAASDGSKRHPDSSHLSISGIRRAIIRHTLDPWKRFQETMTMPAHSNRSELAFDRVPSRR